MTKVRRLNDVLVSYWLALKGENELPIRQEIDGSDLGEDVWDSCFVAQLDDMVAGNSYKYSHLGGDLNEAYGCDLSDNEESSLIGPIKDKLDAQYRGVINTRMPMEIEGEFTNAKGQTVRFRQCMVPFSMDGVNASSVLGGMRYKIYADGEE